ncbi:CRISPR-associated protein Cas4 [Arsenicibacter rosenii]|uniref:CRISPR-associated exonuclease Cas4 n=1 Tax=Arsenicibacter rosenii TaxID=1750698 RepID=A0A1S2VHF5_9BACT|nr:CRISPR-associated protein Cas4 [Arsenicibacter rosenii]OIN58181.1 CRISPR-associated protein Cas4 [Arsenicibacter rosenii]
MTVTGSLIGMYHICHRELWLHANQIRMEHTSEAVAEGKQLHERTYPQRAERFREIELEGSKIDFYDPHNKVVHEIKKSDKFEHSHIAQVKFYLYLLRRNGVEGATGVIEYPKLRQTERVELTDEEVPQIEQWVQDIQRIVADEHIPERLKKSKCRSCSYFDFCYVGE